MNKLIQNIDSLLQAVLEERRIKYLVFMSHEPPADGSVNSSCLSQWFYSPFELKGIQYLTAEHYMMAEKARLFGDHTIEEQILKSTDPGKVQALGRQVRGFEVDVWAKERFDVAIRGNQGKFEQNENIKSYLIGTNDRVLVEANPRDSIWGIGLERKDDRVQNPEHWQGLNLLGFALMQVREKLKK